MSKIAGPFFVKCLSLFSLFLYCTTCLSQPIITSVNPLVGPVGASVNIIGTNFNPLAANNVVYFGAARGNVVSASMSSIVVIVPVNATYGRISLAANGFTSFSPLQFNVTSGNTLTDSSFNTKDDFSTGSYPEFIARGDLDGDGLPDMVVSNYNSASISVFRNNSTPGKVSFASASAYGTAVEPEGVKIDDINSDGKPDVIVTSITGHLFSVFLNTSSIGNISFGSRLDYTLGNSYWSRGIAAGDIDGDGRVDIVTADNNKIIDFTNNTSSGTVSVSRNTGAGNAVSFAAPQSFNTGEYSRSVFIADIDGDSKPDVAVANQGAASMSVFLNNSSPGNISLNLQQTLALKGNGEQITMGDIDGDGKTDIVVSDIFSAPYVSVFRNTSSRGSISFDAPVNIATGGPLGISIGDIDGDTKPDLAIANYNTSAISVLKNTSTPGNISFAPAMNFIAGNLLVDVKIGDVDGDNYPDLTVTNAQGNIVSVLRMKVKPPPQLILNLGNDTTICEGDSVILKTNMPGAQYLWNTGATTEQIVAIQKGNYWVKVTTPGAVLYDSIDIKVTPGPLVWLGNDTLLCKGNSLALNAFNTGASYLWNNGSTAASENVTAGGIYFVTVNNQGCVKSDTIIIAYDSIPHFTLGPDTLLCSGQSMVLNPRITGAHILWQDGSITPTFTVSEPGMYKAIIANSCGSSGDEIVITSGNCNVYIPSAFTPNQDHLNDVFKPIIYGQLISFHFQVFDRWGKEVFSTSDPARGWDGKLNGTDAPSGMFVWRCIYQLQGKEPGKQKGRVLLVR